MSLEGLELTTLNKHDDMSNPNMMSFYLELSELSFLKCIYISFDQF